MKLTNYIKFLMNMKYGKTMKDVMILWILLIILQEP